MTTSQVPPQSLRYWLLLAVMTVMALLCILSAMTGVPKVFAQSPSPDTPTDISPSPTSTLPAQATHYTSIFDTPSAPVITPQPDGASAQPTHITSIFDSPTQTAPTGEATAVTSIFDTQQTAPSSGVTSIFDNAPANVIQFVGEEPPDKAYCLSCHQSPYLQMSFASGETLSVTVNDDEYSASVHGQHGTDGYRCIRCHEDMNAYPHEEVIATTIRELTIELSTSCVRCHPDKYQETLDGIHVTALAAGNQDAAVCSDCHSAHSVERLTDEQTGDPLLTARLTSAQMCKSCHEEIYELYATSVHGSALLEGNPDVPVCANCHGTHDTQGPTSEESFRLFSPQTCADCHADEKLMEKYDISTDVFETYVADFHGTTVTIFQSTDPEHDLNTPVCSDCHGVHEIAAVDSPESPVIKENLVSTCQRCHPDANTNFPSAWLSHYQPSFERTPLVASANLVYQIAIPLVVGGLGLFVTTDIYRRRINRRKEQ